jgi:uncharacterized OB-fold protein
VSFEMSLQRIPVRPDLLSADLEDLSAVTLMGSRCRQCAETALGVSSLCQNCGSADLKPIALGREGVLWTYTVVRHKPPGDYRGPEPFVPFGLGLVELPEGIRVLAPLGGAVDALHIGQPLVFSPTLLKGDAGDEIVAFEFVPPNTNTGVVS